MSSEELLTFEGRANAKGDGQWRGGIGICRIERASHLIRPHGHLPLKGKAGVELPGNPKAFPLRGRCPEGADEVDFERHPDKSPSI